MSISTPCAPAVLKSVIGTAGLDLGRLCGDMGGARDKRDQGASLVEFAVLAPLLVLLVFGIIEFGWKLGQLNDVRHAVREGARFAAVNGGTNDEIDSVVCDALDLVGSGITQIRTELTRIDDDGDLDFRSR